MSYGRVHGRTLITRSVPIIHLRSPSYAALGSHAQTACGDVRSNWTDDRSLVTCLHCIGTTAYHESSTS